MLPRKYRLDLARSFPRFKKYALSIKTPFFTLLWLPKKVPFTTQVGFVVSNRIGKAVVRNQSRRLLREAIYQNLSILPAEVDLILIASPRTHEATVEVLKSNIASALNMVGKQTR